MNLNYDGINRFHLFDHDPNNDHDGMQFYLSEDELFSKDPIFFVTQKDSFRLITICLFEPRYFQSSHIVEATDFENELDNFLREPFTNNMTKWEHMRNLWCSINGGIDKYKDLKQPDYTKLQETKPKRRSLWQMIVSKWRA